jgi:hypothetical protein
MMNWNASIHVPPEKTNKGPKMYPRRLSKEQIKELRSRFQLADCLLAHGEWVPDPVITDLGEDINVRIFDNGRFSGIVFLVQLKGTDRLARYLRKTGYLSYKIEVKDLEHWIVSAIPVIFILWDITNRTGRWVSISDAVVELAERNSNWASQKTASIRIPFTNHVDTEGLDRLRKYLADYYFPVISKGKRRDLDIELHIPNTPDGREFSEALDRFFKAGEAVEIDRKFIYELKHSEWYERLYGKTSDFESSPSFILSSREGDIIPTRLDLFPDNGPSASIPYLELRVIRQGLEEALVSNRGQPIPLQFEMYFIHQEYQIGHRLVLAQPGANIFDTREALTTLSAWARGGWFQLTNLINQQTNDFIFSPGFLPPTHCEFLELVDKLCIIQQRTGHHMALKALKLTGEDVQTIKELTSILQTGKVTLNASQVELELNQDLLQLSIAALKQGKGVKLEHVAESTVELLGETISLGSAIWHIVGRPLIDLHELERLVSDLEPGGTARIRFTVDGIAEFDKWLKDSS